MVSRLRVWQVLLVISLLALALSGCGDPSLNALDPSGSAAEKQLDIIIWSFLVMLGVFIVVTTIYVYVLIRFRKRKGVERTPSKSEGSWKAEVTWTVIPIILLAILAVPTVTYTFDLADVPDKEEAVYIKVTGYQYWWEFEYPDLGIKTAQEMHIPVGKKVRLEIHGKDVIHSFWVPALGGKTDVIPGRQNDMWLEANKAGVFQGKCAELCGAGHALMDFKVYADEEQDFNKWVADMQKAPVTADADKKGEEVFKQNCLTCHAGVDPKIKGPDLSKFGTRDTIAGFLPNDKENLDAWLKDSESLKPGSNMPKIDYLSDEEFDALTQYLLNRK